MNKQIIEEAAEWFIEFSTGNPDRATKQAFDVWLRKSPEHVRVYLELLPIWEDAAMPLPGQNPNADELIAWARQPESVVSWHGTRDSQAPTELSAATYLHAARSPTRYRLPRIRRALAASLVLAVIGGFALWSLTFNGQTYTTGVGEQRIIKLDDGSTVELNTASRVRVHFSKHQRDIDLNKGQALFHVAKDPTRPFIVASNDTRIRAVGTEFDVYRRETGTTVTVLEGQVAVLNNAARTGAGTADATQLSAGEQITVNAPIAAASPPSPRHTNVSTATAWTQHRLIFDATPLTEVAAEFNRYNTRHLIVEDKGLSDFHVSGSFASTDPSSLLRFLEAQHGLSVHESMTDIRISSQ
jgi:transmembrane sensor